MNETFNKNKKFLVISFPVDMFFVRKVSAIGHCLHSLHRTIKLNSIVSHKILADDNRQQYCYYKERRNEEHCCYRILN